MLMRGCRRSSVLCCIRRSLSSTVMEGNGSDECMYLGIYIHRPKEPRAIANLQAMRTISTSIGTCGSNIYNASFRLT
jgi:hypothetical protein